MARSRFSCFRKDFSCKATSKGVVLGQSAAPVTQEYRDVAAPAGANQPAAQRKPTYDQDLHNPHEKSAQHREQLASSLHHNVHITSMVVQHRLPLSL